MPAEGTVVRLLAGAFDDPDVGDEAVAAGVALEVAEPAFVPAPAAALVLAAALNALLVPASTPAVFEAADAGGSIFAAIAELAATADFDEAWPPVAVGLPPDEALFAFDWP